MPKIPLTKVARTEHRHGPVVPLYELGPYTPTTRHDAEPVAMSVFVAKETPATDATALRTAPKPEIKTPEIKTPEPRRDIGQRDPILLSDPGITRVDSVPEVLRIDPNETDVLGFGKTRQEREHETRIHNEEWQRRYDAARAYLKSTIRACELDYKHRKYPWES